MLTYEYGTTRLHRLDPRSKFVVQVGFAVAAVTASDPRLLAGLTLFALGTLGVGRLSPLRVLRTYWFVLIVLAIAPLFAMLRFGSPWIVPERAGPTLVAGYQVILVVFVSSVYVKTTPVRETRAALQRHLPGKIGQILGVGVALVFRLFPLLAGDLRRVRLALRARGGEALPTRELIRRLTLLGLQRALARADTLSVALRARCFAWNPTLPELQFRPVDYPVVGLGLALAGLALL